MMSGLVLAVASVAVGRLALSVRTFCICQAHHHMNDASRKNMMSISGMISRRVFRQGKGEQNFHGVVFPSFPVCVSGPPTMNATF